ncbi:MAG: hypothetical protein WCP10_04490 [Desulfuromonadales bacterium]
MIKTASAALVCLILYGIMIVPFTTYLRDKPFEEKLGYVPTVAALKAVAADHKELIGAGLVMKVLMYYGGLLEKNMNKVVVPPDFMTMSRLLHGAVRLDPYNMDAYYFAQSFLTWEVGQYQIANDLMDYGMKYRDWDWYLPFFAGFNSAYFLKDSKKAAEYYKRAGELSGTELSRLLAGRYMQESGQTELAIAYLTAMEKGEKNEAIRKNFQIRLAAFKETLRIEIARDRFRSERGAPPVSIDQLRAAGYLVPLPKDPYGGQFYLEPDGKVATTSKYAFAGAKKESSKGAADERH